MLPITVTARDNQPPTFTGAQVEFNRAAEDALTLVKLTRYPYAKDQSELSYRILDPKPTQVSVAAQGQSPTVQVSDKTPKARSSACSSESAMPSTRGRRVTDVTVVPSTRPLAVPQPDRVLMPLAIQVHHAVCAMASHVGRMLNELQQTG